MRKRRLGESSVGKVAGLVHVLHKHVSIRAEMYLGMPAGSPDCHPERNEGSIALGSEMLRGVYTERSECAQHDRAVTYTDASINVFFSIFGPYGWSDSFVNVHYNRGNTLVANA
jgi:hypothetical protein